MNIGVLALQGSVAEHLKMIKSVNKKIGAVPVRTIDELATVDGLIIPGGESTTLRRLMDAFNLYTPIKERIVAGMPEGYLRGTDPSCEQGRGRNAVLLVVRRGR